MNSTNYNSLIKLAAATSTMPVPGEPRLEAVLKGLTQLGGAATGQQPVTRRAAGAPPDPSVAQHMYNSQSMQPRPVQQEVSYETKARACC